MITDVSAVADIDEWRAELSELYDRIGSWLGEMETPPTMTRRMITLNERRSGPYEAEELVLSENGRTMEVRPIARWVMGADGRVDVTGIEGPFILVNLKGAGGWHWIKDDPREEPQPLTGELLRWMVSSSLR